MCVFTFRAWKDAHIHILKTHKLFIFFKDIDKYKGQSKCPIKVSSVEYFSLWVKP